MRSRALVSLLLAISVLPVHPDADLVAQPRGGSVVTSDPDLAVRLEPLRFRTGTPIRLRVGRDSVLTGALASSSRDTISITGEMGALLAVPTARITAIDVQYDATERHARLLEGFAIGAGIGAAGGALFGLNVPIQECGDPAMCSPDIGDLNRTGSVVVGAIAGAGLGAALGAAFARSRMLGWQSQPLRRISVAPTLRAGKLSEFSASVRLSYSL